MLKKISLLVSLVMIFSLSCVAFATESADLLAAPAQTEISGEVSGELSQEVSGEVSGDEVSGEVISGEVISGETTPSGEVNNNTTPSTNPDTDNGEATESNNTVVGAIIAIVIVFAVVAIVYVIQKK